MRIVVTGGAGFIGYHLTKALRDCGHEVLVYDNMGSSGAERIHHLDDVEVIEADILDMTRLREACRTAEAIFHLAAQVSVPYSMEEPSVDFDSNLKGTVNVLEAARRVGAKLLFASSAAVYGIPRTVPVPESHSLSPISFYGLSKRSAELYCAMYSNAFHLPLTIFRIFNAYGPHCHGVVYDALKKLSVNPNHLHMLGKPDASKDFVYISDVIDAMMDSLKTDYADGLEIFNIGSGVSTTIADLSLHICDILDAKPLVRFSGSSWAGDITEGLRADTSKLSSRFGWRGRISLREGLSRTVDWFLSEEAEAEPIPQWAGGGPKDADCHPN